MIRLAREKGLLPTPYVFCEDDASAMAEAGADIVVCHLGLTTGGSIGAETALKLADCPAKVDAWAAAALKVTPDIIVLVHGRPVSMPEAPPYVLHQPTTCPRSPAATPLEPLPPTVAWPSPPQHR